MKEEIAGGVRTVGTLTLLAMLGWVSGCGTRLDPTVAKSPILSGVYDVTEGPFRDTGDPPQEAPATIRTWVAVDVGVRTGCCVAVAIARQTGTKPPEKRVLDYIDGRWWWVGETAGTCRREDGSTTPSHRWESWSLTAQPDGGWTGSTTQITTAQNCSERPLHAPVSLSPKKLDSTLSVPDANAEPDRVSLAADGFNGTYLYTSIPDEPNSALLPPSTVVITTYCLRAEKRCATLMLFYYSPTHYSLNTPLIGTRSLAYADGAWKNSVPAAAPACPRNGTSDSASTATEIQLPELVTKPIRSVLGTEQVSGGCLPGERRRITFDRIGD